MFVCSAFFWFMFKIAAFYSRSSVHRPIPNDVSIMFLIRIFFCGKAEDLGRFVQIPFILEQSPQMVYNSG